ncbi:1-phosphofructokinase [Siculibacillus lacustris]|uniref:Phosphofructokinase n=1 Tax=Siculibacillus lacustris TaxID=1549641 RepID=A0A4Q9VJA1_9HYPH|nr:1-phosphofructokinase [Siculibacillus lacustris]TBW35387.1 1-phosphofructokinase [Siculibacillus lacustris]
MIAPVITVTLNPAIDLTVTVAELRLGSVQRARTAQSGVGGKGINVAGCLADWGTPVVVTGVLGRSNAEPFSQFFAVKRIDDRFVRAVGETRTNIKIADLASGDTTDINLPGLPVDVPTCDLVWDTLVELVRPHGLVVLAGSLPEGLPDDTWARLIADLTHHGARVVLDTSEGPFAAALAAPAEHLPHCVKPNRRELEAWAGRPLPETSDLIAVARDLNRRGVELVVVSLGPEGALFVRDGKALSARLPPMRVLSTVGAGDAMVAGTVAGLRDGLGLPELARLAVAFATGKLAHVGPHLPARAEIEALAAQVALTTLAG